MKNRTTHCLPIIETNPKRVREGIVHARATHTYFEVWLDYLEDVPPGFLPSLVSEFSGKLIFVSRRLNLDPMKRPYAERMLHIEELAGLDCYIDFDIRTQGEELEAVRSNGWDIRKLISYHNYESTPALQQLEEILQQMQAFQPAISKVACYCRSESDSLRLLSLLVSSGHNKDVIILGMGEHGLATRILGPLYGNAFTFSPLSRDRESAPGQLTHSELESILEILAHARE